MGEFPKVKREKRNGKWRLGISWGIDPIPNSTANRNQYISWAAVGLGRPRHTGPVTEIKDVDPVAALVELWQQQDEPRPPIELYRFKDEQDFQGSRAQCEGSTLDQYRLSLARAAAMLRSVGAEVIIVDAVA